MRREAKRLLGTRRRAVYAPREYKLLTGKHESGEERAVLRGGPIRTAEGVEMQSREDAIALRDALIELVLDWPTAERYGERYELTRGDC